MRKALFTALKMNGHKVYNISHTGARQLPYYLVKFGASIETEKLGSYTTFVITAYANPGDADTLDTLCEECLMRLRNKKLYRISDGKSFIPEFTGDSDDFVYDDLCALGKRLTFRVPKFGADYM